MMCKLCEKGTLLEKDSKFVCNNCGNVYILADTNHRTDGEKQTKNNEIEAQLNLARSAFSFRDYEGAGQCYKKIKETYVNWETCFYSVYCDVTVCDVRDISSNCLILTDSLKGVFEQIKELEGEEKRGAALEEVVNACTHIANKHYYRALDTYVKVDPSIKHSFVSDLREQLNASMGVITRCCQIIISDFEKPELLAHCYRNVLECKSTQKYVHIHLEPSAEEMLAYLDKWDPEFAHKYRSKRMKRKSRKLLWWGIAILALGVAFALSGAFYSPLLIAGVSLGALASLSGGIFIIIHLVKNKQKNWRFR